MFILYGTLVVKSRFLHFKNGGNDELYDTIDGGHQAGLMVLGRIVDRTGSQFTCL